MTQPAAGSPAPQIDTPDELEYLTEGAANVLYRYIGPETSLQTRLLRLRKYLLNSPTTTQLHRHLTNVFLPILTPHILHTKLVSLSPGLLSALNLRLSQVEERGKGKQNDHLDENEAWGFLVEDMTPGVYQKFNDIALRAPPPPSFLQNLPPALVSTEEKTKTNVDNENPKGLATTKDAETMTTEGWRDVMLIEFKPKYLVQSPDAPEDWILCRTCALRHMRSRSLSSRSTSSSIISHTNTSEDEEQELPDYCPFDIVSPTPTRVTRAVEAIIARDGGVTILNEDEVIVSDPELGEDGITPFLDSLESLIIPLLASYFLEPTSIVHILASLQKRFAGLPGMGTGVLSAPTPSTEMSKEDFERMMAGHPTTGKISGEVCTAMSLRDCTVYLRLWMRKCTKRGEDGRREQDYEIRIEAKVGDLDMKTGEGGKGVYWRDVEKRLLRGEWYRNRGFEDVGCREEWEMEGDEGRGGCGS